MLDKIKRFEAKNEKNKRINYYIVYTIIFLVMVPLVYSEFSEQGKSLIRSGDSLTQHFPVLTYFAKILRQTILGVFSENGLQLPLWEFAIGPGADIITTLNYYGVGDPLCLLAVFFPLSKMEIGYVFLILLRIYLAGVSFSAYCKTMGKSRWNTLCGAFAYIFCGYVIFSGIRHPFFINPMIILPLLFIGIEKVFKKEKPYVLILSVFYAAITGVYFFYMLGIFAVLYIFIRCWSFCGENKVKDFFVNLGKLAGSAAVGILLSGVLLIPNIIALLNSSRMQSETAIGAFYDPDYYWHAPIKFLSGGSSGAWTHLGYVALIAVAIFMLFSYRRKNTQLKVGFIISTIMLILPYVGHAMNGFSYVSNRWIWGYGFLLAFIMTTMLPKIVKIDGKRFVALLIIAVIYLSYLYWFLFDINTKEIVHRQSKTAITLYYIVLGVIIISFVWSLIVKKRESARAAKVRVTVVKSALLVTILVNTLLQANMYYSPEGINYVSEFIPPGEAYERQTEVANIVYLIGDTDGFYRYSENSYDRGQLKNGSLISQVHSNSAYYSIIDENYLTYMSEIACNDILDTRVMKGLDSRTGLNALSSAKYYIVETTKSDYVPYGHTELFKNGRFSAYENEYYLPLGYTYENRIPQAKYELLDGMQREQAMLQGVVLDEEMTKLPTLEPQMTAQKRDNGIVCRKGVTFENNKFIVSKRGAKADITFDGLSDSETYLIMNNLRYQAPTDEEGYLTASTIKVTDDGSQKEIDGQAVRKQIDIQTPYHTWYSERHNFVVNMGYATRTKNKLVFEFTEKGEYTFDDMSIICQPMTDYAEQVAKLKEEVLENVVVGTNKVNGTIDLKETKFLCMSIPYNKGWTLYVDGERRELLRANTAYMGVELEAGHHEIELRYFTPYLEMAIACTIVGMILLATIIIVNKRKSKQNKS